MSLKFNALSPHLVPTAELTLRYFSRNRGIKGFEIEKPVFDVPGEGGLRPTFLKVDRNGAMVCIEVQETASASLLRDFIDRCCHECMEMKLYIAFPEESEDVGFKSQLVLAKLKGIGLLEVGARKVVIHNEALSSHLSGLRPVKGGNFPEALRERILLAEKTYLDGNPLKGCLGIHEIIEAYTREIALQAHQKGFWKDCTMIALKWSKAPWANVAERLCRNFSYVKAGCPELNEVFFSKIQAITADRNPGGHLERDPKKRSEQNKRLRTRFEYAVDLLSEILDAVRPMKIRINQLR